MTRRDLTSPYYPGGGNTNEQVTVFHSLNGSDAKGTTGRSNPSRRKQKGYPKVFYPRDTITAQIQRPVVPHLPKISTGLPFLFRSPEPLFLLNQKKKWFWPQPGGQKSDFPRKGYAPSVRRRSTHRARAVSKRHSRQETACPQRLGCGPRRAGHIFTNDKGMPFCRSKVQHCRAFLSGGL